MPTREPSILRGNPRNSRRAKRPIAAASSAVDNPSERDKVTPVCDSELGHRGQPGTLLGSPLTSSTDFTATSEVGPVLPPPGALSRCKRRINAKHAAHSAPTVYPEGRSPCALKSLQDIPQICPPKLTSSVCSIRLHQCMWILDCGHRN